MKKIMLLTLFLALFFTYKAEAKSPAYFEFGIFYSSLSPHGTWLELEPGFVVWRPTIMKRWAPYRSGQWVWTEYGWYWDSYEPFGHITYHYGRWYHDDYYGWIWVPDYEWGPAWVEWRYDNDYIGWAPLPPYATFSIGVGIVFTNTYYTPYNHWHYIRYNNFCDPYPYNYYIADKHKYRIHSRTKYRSDYDYRDGRVYNRGVDYEYVRERSGRDIKQREVVRVNNERDLRGSNGRNDDRIRTFAASREDLRKSSDGLRDVKFERSDRKSSLLTSKVEIGDRKNDSRNDVRTSRKNEEPVLRDKNSNDKFSGSGNDVKTSRSGGDVKSSREVNKPNSSRNSGKSDVRTKVDTRQEVNRDAQKKQNVVPQKSNVQPNVDSRKEMSSRDLQKKQNVQPEKRDLQPRFEKRVETRQPEKKELFKGNTPQVDQRQKVEKRTTPETIRQETRKQQSPVRDPGVSNRNEQKNDREVKRSSPEKSNTPQKSEDRNDSKRRR